MDGDIFGEWLQQARQAKCVQKRQYFVDSDSPVTISFRILRRVFERREEACRRGLRPSVDSDSNLNFNFQLVRKLRLSTVQNLGSYDDGLECIALITVSDLIIFMVASPIIV
jgi:hypothetical protein